MKDQSNHCTMSEHSYHRATSRSSVVNEYKCRFACISHYLLTGLNSEVVIVKTNSPMFSVISSVSLEGESTLELSRGSTLSLSISQSKTSTAS